MAEVLTVTSLNLYVKSILENDKNLINIAVEGELSNFKKYPSGHCYFTLKDENSSIKGVMFSSYVRNLSFTPDNGMKVIIRGKVSIYERDGAYQIYATDMFRSGDGAYRLAFERLKAKLEQEGLFDRKHKKTLPENPFKIGVATSAKGAALHDIISVAQRRFPCVEIVLCPCMVQGSEAEPTIINAIKKLDSIEDIELIIIARGGGSKEDLWVFNSEKIARAAYSCNKPTISAIGHEIDFSILDFVCDVRAATPTAAAELALPDINALNMKLSNLERVISSSTHSLIDNYQNRLAFIEKSEGFVTFKNNLQNTANKLENINYILNTAINNKLSRLQDMVIAESKVLENQSPLNNLKRGYSLIYDKDMNVKQDNFTAGESVKIITLNQELDCLVTNTKPREENKYEIYI